MSAFWNRQLLAAPCAPVSRELSSSCWLVNSWVNAEIDACAESVGRNRDLAARTPHSAARSRARKACSEGFSSRASASSCFSSHCGSVTGKVSGSSFAFTRLKRAGISLRLVRSPEAPKRTNTQGPATLPAANSAGASEVAGSVAGMLDAQ